MSNSYVFNQLRISYLDFYGKEKTRVVHDLDDLLIRENTYGMVTFMGRQSPVEFTLDVSHLVRLDEYGAIYRGCTAEGERVEVKVTRQGIYS